MIHKDMPDVLILDVNMPVMDGFEVLKALGGDFKGMEIICTTGFDKEEMDWNLDSIPSDVVFLKKPFSPEYLKRLISIRQGAKGPEAEGPEASELKTR